jgi:aldehyde dehydrogenase family 7 protein A1
MAQLTFNDYPFLKELGLAEDNLGVYNGKWFGNGKDLVSVNPTNNKPIARIRGVRSFYNAVFGNCTREALLSVVQRIVEKLL